MSAQNQAAMRQLRFAARAGLLLLLALPMAPFFAFVGWYMAFEPMAELARHHAWTAHLPVWIGRPFGLTELAAAAAIALAALPVVGRRVRPLGVIAALWLAASQVVAAAVHFTWGEVAALPQNLVLFIALLVIAALCRDPSTSGD